ncbi:MAG TPA: hypothetical protein VIM02_08930 [Rhizomicrobium sp.]|jgi:hypothetical protein
MKLIRNLAWFSGLGMSIITFIVTIALLTGRRLWIPPMHFGMNGQAKPVAYLVAGSADRSIGGIPDLIGQVASVFPVVAPLAIITLVLLLVGYTRYWRF